MSLRGRRVIDRLKTFVGNHLKLPCPPYGNPLYWKGVYKSLGPSDVHEWGSATLAHDLLEYTYQLLPVEHHQSPSNNDSRTTLTSTFAEAIGVSPNENDDDDDDDDKPIMLLGCGNSKLGEDMAEFGWRGPLIQVDVVSRVLETMAQRSQALVDSGVMEFVQDDAIQLSAFDDDYVNAVIDKGLVDALFCADDYKQVERVVGSVHRVLKPGGIFLLFSLSQPEFLMPRILSNPLQQSMWKDIQVRQLESILMYRLEKMDDSQRRKGPTKESLQRKQKSKRR